MSKDNMSNVNKTMYIPLYGKAKMSREGLILDDKMAEDIWEKESITLKRKSRSKWLIYFMAMRAKVYDEWAKMQLLSQDDAIILHIGVGMDSRYLRVGDTSHEWYDIDFPNVISERRKYYEEKGNYHMVEADITKDDFLDGIEGKRAIVIMEGVCMYLSHFALDGIMTAIERKFEKVNILLDVYTSFGVKMSKVKNPINDMGKIQIYGVDHPHQVVQNTLITFIAEHSMTPQNLVDELKGVDRFIFSHFFAGNVAKKLYRLYEYKK